MIYYFLNVKHNVPTGSLHFWITINKQHISPVPWLHLSLQNVCIWTVKDSQSSTQHANLLHNSHSGINLFFGVTLLFACACLSCCIRAANTTFSQPSGRHVHQFSSWLGGICIYFGVTTYPVVPCQSGAKTEPKVPRLPMEKKRRAGERRHKDVRTLQEAT